MLSSGVFKLGFFQWKNGLHRNLDSQAFTTKLSDFENNDPWKVELIEIEYLAALRQTLNGDSRKIL